MKHVFHGQRAHAAVVAEWAARRAVGRAGATREAVELDYVIPRSPRPEPERRHGRPEDRHGRRAEDRKSTRLNSSHSQISYAVFCLKKKKEEFYKRRDLTRADGTRVDSNST